MPDNPSPTINVHVERGWSSIRQRVFLLLETAEANDRASRITDIFLIALIAINVFAVVLESIASLKRAYGAIFDWIEVITICVFSVEYLLRVWSSVERKPAFAGSPTAFRLQYMVSFHAIIDLLAILPFYLLMFGTFGNIDLRFLRAVRLLRVLKLTRYSSALDMLVTTVKENSRALAAAFLVLITVMLLAASGMYYFERQSQPVDFGSIPAAMWWAFATLTTVGYGDVTPMTIGGKVFGALITVVGVGMVALPTGILASGYNQQLQLRARMYGDKADEALHDGILTKEELSDLEKLRVDLGISKNVASQLLDAGRVRATLQTENAKPRCPHCNVVL